MKPIVIAPVSTAAVSCGLTNGQSRSGYQGSERRERAETDRRRNHDRRTADQVKRRMVYGLEELVWDGTPVPPPARIVAAARVFTEGDHYFTGQIIDRSA